MTSNAEIAKAMADNMTHAAVPLYGKSTKLAISSARALPSARASSVP